MNAYKIIGIIAFPLCASALQLDKPEGLPSSTACDQSIALQSSSCQPAPAPDTAPAASKDANATGLRDVFAGENNASAQPQPAAEKEKEEKPLKEKISGDASGLGIQRLVEVTDSKITVTANYNTRYLYRSNPLSIKSIEQALPPRPRDIMVWENGLSVNVGLGQLALLDRVVTPSFMAMNLRQWTDPHKKYSDDFHSSDVDVQLVSLTFSMELPKGLGLNLGYAQSRVMSVRDEVAIVYTESPSLALSKTMMVRGNPLMLNLGTAYNFTDVVALPLNPELAAFFMTLPDPVNIPADGSNGWATNFSMNYMVPVKSIEGLMISPTFAISHAYGTDEKSLPDPLEGKQDWAFNYGLNATYQLTDTVSIQAFGMFTKKTLNSHGKYIPGKFGTEYKNFDAGVGLSASFQF